MAAEPLVAVDVAPPSFSRQTSQPVQGIHLEWRNVCYTVKEKKKGKGKGKGSGKGSGEAEVPSDDKPILQNISGDAQPRTFTCILGASGSGKTSLLSVLADRLLASKGATLTGTLTVNGEKAPDDYRAQCAYVQQTEIFYPFATVRETVEMAARLRGGAGVSVEVKKERAEEVIRELGLSGALDTTVGDGNRVKGISGGEMKRLSIACELVSSPGMVMLDEPTSGLDSHAALNVVRNLDNLAKKSGRTVVASIHQPGSPIYNVFSNIIVLAEGRTAYFGGKDNVISHFTGIKDGGFEIPAQYNPADFMLQITSVDYSNEESEVLSKKNLDLITRHAPEYKPFKSDEQLERLRPATKVGTAYGEQFALLYKRCLRDAVRNKFATLLKVIQSLVTTLIMVGLYSKIDSGGVVMITVSNITALLFFVVITGLFGPLFGTIQAFAPEVNIVLRERMNNLYAMGPYYVAKLLVAIPFELLPLLIGNTVAFWALQLNHTPARYVVFLVFTCGMTLASVGIGFSLASVFAGNVQASSAAVGPLAIIFLLLGGFYINTSTIPPWIAWLSKINYVNWAYRGIAINEFHGYTVTSRLSNSSGTFVFTKSGNDILNEQFNNGVLCPSEGCLTEDEWVQMMWMQFVYICIAIVLFNSLGYLALVLKGPKYLSMTAAAGRE